MRKPFLFSLLLLLIACSSGPVPKEVLQPQKLQKVVNDLIKVDEFLNSFVYKDSTINIKNKRSSLYEQVFKVNNTTRREFYSSYKYYQQHPDLQKKIFDSLYETLNRKKMEVIKVKS